MAYLTEALEIFKTKSRLSEQDKILRKMVHSLNNLQLPEQQKDFLFYFIMQAYLMDPANKNLFGFSETFKAFKGLAENITWDQNFLQTSKSYFSSANNLKFALLFAAGEVADHYHDNKMNSRSASQESKNLVMQIRQMPLSDNLNEHRNLINQINDFFRQRNKGSLFKWLNPLWVTYSRLENNLALSMENLHVRNKVPSLITTINNNFENASKPPEENKKLDYVTTGQKTYNFSLSGLDISSDSLLTQLVHQNNNSGDKIEILDIGTGSGEFIYNINDINPDIVEAYGITAREYRSLDKQKEDQHYIFDNAEYLNRIFPNQKFDYIFSRFTFCHLTDPAAALIQAYDRLKTGGILIIDNIRFPGLDGHLQDMIETLKANGYAIAGNAWEDGIYNLVIQKTADRPTLELPMQYNQVINTSVGAKASYHYVGQHYDDYSAFYKNGADRMAHLISQDSGMSKIIQTSNLQDVFHDKDYMELPIEKQYIVILGIVARQTDYSEYQDILNQNIDPSILADINDSNDFSAIFRLFGQIQFKALDEETQNQILMVAAVKDLIRLGQQETDGKLLKAMGLPIEVHQPGFDNSNQKIHTNLVRETHKKTLLM